MGTAISRAQNVVGWLALSLEASWWQFRVEIGVMCISIASSLIQEGGAIPELALYCFGSVVLKTHACNFYRIPCHKQIYKANTSPLDTKPAIRTSGKQNHL